MLQPSPQEDPYTAWTTECCLRPYHPYRLGGAQNPAFVHAFDGRLLDFKDGVELAVKLETREFLRGLEQLEFPFRTQLVIVPGHDARASNEGTPLARAAHERHDSRENIALVHRQIPNLVRGDL